MNLSDAMFAIAAGQLRSTAATLDAQIAQLRDTHEWRGPDADKFFQEWETDVTGKLHAAAMKLDALALIPFL